MKTLHLLTERASTPLQVEPETEQSQADGARTDHSLRANLERHLFREPRRLQWLLLICKKRTYMTKKMDLPTLVYNLSRHVRNLYKSI